MPGPAEADPRPLIGEPLAVDLLNTRWIDAAGRHDLLDSLDGLASWLASPAVAAMFDDHRVAADDPTLTNLLGTRAALDALVDAAPPSDRARRALNEVLAHGRLRRVLGPEGPRTVTEVDDPSWMPAWTAASSYLHLLDDRPERLRPCANPACILHFYDVSKNGTRRWCSMAGCGNRAKASRHYARQGNTG
ncbi:CGNR zinc finger domain-containing protein [Streptomyces sp. NPDC001732]